MWKTYCRFVYTSNLKFPRNDSVSGNRNDFFFPWENTFIFFWSVGRCLTNLRTSGLASWCCSLHDQEHVEAHSLAQGPALAHCGSVTDLDIPDAGGQVHRYLLVAFLKVVVLLL